MIDDTKSLVAAVAGDIAFSGKNKPGWYSRIVMFMTSSPWSHSFLIAGDCLGDLSVLEADLNIVMVPFEREYFEKKIDHYEVWRPVKASADQMAVAAKATYRSFSGDTYGFFEVPWFVWRVLLSKVGIKVKNNWFKGGVICSELVFSYLLALGGDYAAMVSGFGPDNVSPQDLYGLVTSRPDLFVFVGRREAT